MEYNINLIDPSKVFYVKDLYYLTSRKIKSLPKGAECNELVNIHGTLTVGWLTKFFNKPLHQCKLYELKLLWLLGICKYKIILSELNKLPFINSLFLQDFCDVIKCYISELNEESEDNLIINMFKPNMRILKKAGLYGLKDLKIMSGLVSSPVREERGNYPINKYINEEDTRRMKSGYIMINYSDRYKRPFFDEPKIYPKIKVKDTYERRIRDLLSINSVNDNNNVVTFLESNRKLLCMTVNQYHKFLSKPVEDIKISDLDNIQKILSDKDRYSGYLVNFQKVRPIIESEINNN